MSEVSRVQEPDEVGRCGNKALQVAPQWGAQVFCRLPAGHAGWHRGDDDSEWTNNAAPVVADRDIPEEMVEAVARELYGGDASDRPGYLRKARRVLSAALAGRQVVAAIAPSEMPPVPCPDCMHPTEHDGDLFHCTGCGQAFSTPNGMDLSMWQELWRAWTAGRQVVELPEPNVHHADRRHDGPEYGWWPLDEHDVRAFLADGRGRVGSGKPHVRVHNSSGSVVFAAADAESVAAAILAAGPAAEGLAAGSGSGEDATPGPVHPDGATEGHFQPSPGRVSGMTDPIDELAVRVLNEHLLAGPRPGQCRCGWGDGSDVRTLGRSHSKHVVEQLRAVGALTGSGSGEADVQPEPQHLTDPQRLTVRPTWEDPS